MSTSRQLYSRKYHLPHHNSTQIHQALELIQQKRQQLMQKEHKQHQHECSLPLIQPNVLKNNAKTSQPSQQSSSDNENQPEQSQIFTRSPVVKYKTMLQETNAESQHEVTPTIHNATLDSTVVNLKIKTTAPRLHINHFKSEHHKVHRKSYTKTETEHRTYEKALKNTELISNAKKQFLQSLTCIPKQIKYRNEATLALTLNNLQVFNPFFSRNHRIVNVCLLKVGKIIFKQNSVLYKIGEQSSVFYIILSGRVKLINGNLKRVCQTGETILEQVLFEERLKKIGLQRAKAVGKVWLLEISMEQLKSMREEMIRHRFKQEMHEMQALVKRNHIVKNWLRNKMKKEAQL